MKRPEWVYKLNQYSKPQLSKSIYQLVTTVVPYLFLLATLMVLMKFGIPRWIILAFMPIVSCFLVRIFILMHDCSHKSFLKSDKALAIVGHILGILSFTSFFYWRQSHQIHHATVGNIDKRGVGNIHTLTVNEYKSLSKWKQFLYRMYRNPITLFIIGTIFIFIIMQRVPNKLNKKKEIFSIILTNLSLCIILIIAYFTIGIKIYFAVQIPVFWLAGSFGIWLFYIQHQFENVYWEHTEKWDIYRASIEGSSYYKLPKILQWFTGNIGFHNLHHLNPRIPNYNLEKSYNEIPETIETITITIIKGFKSLFLALWDEKNKKLISFSSLQKVK